jgi:hypothetical protein
MAQAITPLEAQESEGQQIPAFVINSFNRIIKNKFSGGRAQFTMNEVVAEIQKDSSHTRQFLFDKGWMDVEPVFRAQGWKVVYDQPAYNESYAATYTFSVK